MNRDFVWEKASFEETKFFIDSAHIIWMCGGNVNQALVTIRTDPDPRKFEYFEKAITEGRVVLVGNSAGAMLMGARVDLCVDKQKEKLNGDFNGFGFLGPVSVVPHYNEERYTMHEGNGDHKEVRAKALVRNDVGSQGEGKIVILVEGSGFLRVGPEGLMIYNDSRIAQLWRQWTVCTLLPLSYWTFEDILIDDVLHPTTTQMKKNLARAIEEGAIEKEKERYERDLNEEKRVEAEELREAIQKAQRQADETAQYVALMKEKQALLLKEQETQLAVVIELKKAMDIADAAKKQSATMSYREAAKFSTSMKIQVKEAETKLNSGIEKNNIAAQQVAEEKEKVAGKKIQGHPEQLREIQDARIKVAVEIIRTEAVMIDDKHGETGGYLGKSRAMVQFLQNLKKHDHYDAFQINALVDLDPEDKDRIDEMVASSGKRIVAFWNRVAFTDVNTKELRILKTVTLQHYKNVESYTKQARKKHGRSQKNHKVVETIVVSPIVTAAMARLSSLREELKDIDAPSETEVNPVNTAMQKFGHRTGPIKEQRARELEDLDHNIEHQVE